MTTAEVSCVHLERDEPASLAVPRLRLAEAKRLSAAIQAEILPIQMTIVGEDRRTCVACGRVLARKGHHTATFRSRFGDVPTPMRRLLARPRQGRAKQRASLPLTSTPRRWAPEPAYVTTRYATLAPFGKVADLPPVSGGGECGHGAHQNHAGPNA
ncbi:MAG: hypothetical protein ABSC06_26740 [Rhodopila sp.]|jgi:hypothetical protein